MHKSNFDFIRLMAAVSVVVAHSYWLSTRSPCNWLCRAFSDFDISVSQVGLRCLFIISGYLIFQSLMVSRTLLDYFLKRMLRIFPALYVVLLLSVVLGLFVFNGSAGQYVNNVSAWTYLPNNLFLVNLQWSIAGVFENNPYNSAINGSLWSIPYEFLFYILLSPLYFLKNKLLMTKGILVLVFSLLFMGTIFFKNEIWQRQFILSGRYVLDFGLFFVAGSLLSVFKIENWKYLKPALVFGGLLTIYSLYFSFFSIAQYFAVPLTIIPLALASTKYLNNIKKSVGDISYGVYIYSFPIQQTLMHYFKLNYRDLMITSIILSLFFGYLSWHLIEKNALRFKKKRAILTKSHIVPQILVTGRM